MSSLSLFIVGVLVTLLVAGALALLVWGAILDGRAQREFEQERQSAQDGERRRLQAIDAA